MDSGLQVGPVLFHDDKALDCESDLFLFAFFVCVCVCARARTGISHFRCVGMLSISSARVKLQMGRIGLLTALKS